MMLPTVPHIGTQPEHTIIHSSGTHPLSEPQPVVIVVCYQPISLSANQANATDRLAEVSRMEQARNYVAEVMDLALHLLIGQLQQSEQVRQVFCRREGVALQVEVALEDFCYENASIVYNAEDRILARYPYLPLELHVTQWHPDLTGYMSGRGFNLEFDSSREETV